VITNEESHMRWFNYNKLNPSRSFKGKRIFLIEKFYKLYNLKAYEKSEENITLYKA
jgi:ubiquinol-cytochrome c reductase cytochrome b subunit